MRTSPGRYPPPVASCSPSTEGTTATLSENWTWLLGRVGSVERRVKLLSASLRRTTSRGFPSNGRVTYMRATCDSPEATTPKSMPTGSNDPRLKNLAWLSAYEGLVAYDSRSVSAIPRNAIHLNCAESFLRLRRPTA